MAKKPSAKTATLSNFAVTRALSATSGYMFSQMPDGSLVPVKVKRKSLLGTQSQFGAAEDKAGAGNPQEVEIAYLDRDSDTLVVQFGLRAWRDAETANIEACNLAHVEKAMREINSAYKSAGGFGYLGQLYAERIAGAYSLWRNRHGFDRSVRAIITQDGQDEIVLEFGKKPDDSGISTLAGAIEHGLSGSGVVDIQITMRSKIGKGQEVFPSQEMAMNANTSRVLDKDENGQAMMHPWKLTNAIRTIDIWHPSFDEVGAIAIEPYGTNVRRQEAFRYHEGGFYGYLDQIVKAEEKEGGILGIRQAKSLDDLDTIKDAHYFMAVLIRGGVFGMGKKEKAAKSEGGE